MLFFKTMPSNNGKYYMKKKNTNLKNITSLFGKPQEQDSEDTASVEKVDLVDSELPGPPTPIVKSEKASSGETICSFLGKRQQNVFSTGPTTKSKAVTNTKNLQRKLVQCFEWLFPDFSYSLWQKGWFWKVCRSCCWWKIIYCLWKLHNILLITLLSILPWKTSNYLMSFLKGIQVSR